MIQLTALPATFIAGDTFDLLVSNSDFPASDGWVLTYALRGGGSSITLTSTASGDDHLFQVPAVSVVGPPAIAGTDNWTPGDYTAYAYAADATRRFSLGQAPITIKPNPYTIASAADLRSHSKKVLDAIEAVLEGRATTDQEEVTVDTGSGRRSLKRTPVADLLLLRDRYRAEVRLEDGAASGSSSLKRILMRL
jgi:hypothetical protein